MDKLRGFLACIELADEPDLPEASDYDFGADDDGAVRTTLLRKRHGTIAKSTAKTDGNVFIGHGRSEVWRVLKDFIQDRLKLPWDEFNREATAGFATKERLLEMLDAASFAFIVMTPEDEHADGTSTHARTPYMRWGCSRDDSDLSARLSSWRTAARSFQTSPAPRRSDSRRATSEPRLRRSAVSWSAKKFWRSSCTKRSEVSTQYRRRGWRPATSRSISEMGMQTKRPICTSRDTPRAFALDR
jgi:hypothetical protein